MRSRINCRAPGGACARDGARSGRCSHAVRRRRPLHSRLIFQRQQLATLTPPPHHTTRTRHQFKCLVCVIVAAGLTGPTIRAARSRASRSKEFTTNKHEYKASCSCSAALLSVQCISLRQAAKPIASLPLFARAHHLLERKRLHCGLHFICPQRSSECHPIPPCGAFQRGI